MTIATLLATFLLTSSGLPSAIADDKDPRIDKATGREAAVWPPDRHFDHLSMTLELEFPDITAAKLKGVETLTVAAVGVPRQVLRLDCKGPEIKSVTCGGAPCAFSMTGEKGATDLLITLPQPVAPGQQATVVIAYDLEYSKNKGEGLTYSKANAGSDSLTRQSPQIHAQGEAELNSKWFPCHDSPNEKFLSRLIVTVEDGFDVVSNGHLASKTAAGNGPDGKARTRWDWVQDKPHSPYLVTLVIGKFAKIELGGPKSGRPGLDIPVYTPWGTETLVKELYSKTPDMIAFFEKKFTQPYPWDKYAQCIVRDFSAGGMENTSCTLMTTGSARGEPGSQDDLISHELAHQWFGDLVTCNSWGHIWLNEGWASYCESLWREFEGSKQNEEKARTAYQRSVRGFFQSQRFRNRTSWPEYTPMVTNRYTDPDNLFTRPEDPYAKGAMLLHMLRQRVGDEAFFAGTRAYLEKYKFKTAETSDYRREIEAASGQSLERFFDQWAFRPGLPRVAVELAWNEATKSLDVSLTQKQTIDANNPAFVFSLPVRVKFEDGTTRWVELEVEGKNAKASFPLAAKPTQVTVDPGMTVMAPTEITKDLAWWLDESRDPASYHAMACATEALLALRQHPDRSIAASAAARLETLETDARTPSDLAQLIHATMNPTVAAETH
jgi:aminopeptidase N